MIARTTHLLAIFVIYALLPATIWGAFRPAMRPIDVLKYTIKSQLNPAEDPTTFDATVVIKLKTTKPLKVITLDAEHLEIKAVRLLKPMRTDLKFHTKALRKLTLAFPRQMRRGEVATLQIDYVGKINKKTHYGLFKVFDPDEPDRGPLLFTQLEPTGARQFFPCNDEPYDKAITELQFTVPARYEVISNGKRTYDMRYTKNNVQWRDIHWQIDQPHSTYLVSVAIGRFYEIQAKSGSIPSHFWIGKTKIKKAQYAVEMTQAALDFQQKYLRVNYPWQKYDTIGTPTFMWGGMENTTATHMNQERILLNDPNSEFEKKNVLGLVAHEIAHQWFGNSVTMNWWEDLWLNESFASYLDTITMEAIFKNEEATVDLITNTWHNYFREENGPRSHPIVNKHMTSADDAFDSTTYTKGQNVLRMLNFYMGEAKFRKSIKDYLTRFRYANATYKDFFESAEKASGLNLRGFRDSWLLQRGYPILTYGGLWNKTTKAYQLELAQRSNHAKDKSVFHFQIPIVYHRTTAPQYEIKKTLTVSSRTYTAMHKLPAEPEWVTVNPNAIVLTKLEPKDRNQATIVKQALRDPDKITRIWASFELIDALEKSDKTTSDSAVAQSTLLNVINKDSSPYVRIALLERLQRSKRRWYPNKLAEGIYALAKKTQSPGFARTREFRSDIHGWRSFRSEVLGALGKVKKKEAVQLLAKALDNPQVGLDDLQKATHAIASIGSLRTPNLLRRATHVHGKRGYRFRYWVQYAYGAYQNPRAAIEIDKLTRTASPDLIGRIGWTIKDNQTLIRSKEWPLFLTKFILKNERFGDDVKARLLQTIEQTKTKHVLKMLKTITNKTKSKRIREATQKILEKNFPRSTRSLG